MPSFTEVDDPDIREVYYDEQSQTLILYYRRGGSRTYSGIAPSVASAFTRSLDVSILDEVATVAETVEEATRRALQASRLRSPAERLDIEEPDQLDLLIRYDEVSSSAIRAMQYDESARQVTVFFTDGAVYSYDGISARAYRALKDSTSIGRYFNEKIR